MERETKFRGLCSVLCLGAVLSTTSLTAQGMAISSADSDEPYFDPCKAPLLIGDIALTQNDYNAVVELVDIGNELNAEPKGEGHGKAKRKALLSHDSISKRVAENSDYFIAKLRSKRAATSLEHLLWPNATIPYEIDNNVNFTEGHKDILRRAMRHWEEHTCLRFVEREPQHYDYIRFQRTKRCVCCSPVGRHGGGQGVNIGYGCEHFGVVVHELGHAIGYWHEHSRVDRDQFVRILWENIIPNATHNFFIKYNTDSLGEPYDYRSIMHYTANAFSVSSDNMTIIPLEQPGGGTPHIGNYVGLSEGDISQTNQLYKCNISECTPGTPGCPLECEPGFRPSADGSTCECIPRSPGCPEPLKCPHEFHVSADGLYCECDVGTRSCKTPLKCPGGYATSPNGLGCVEDKCYEENGGCDHFCTNTPGEVTCTCDTGFILAPDQRRCLDVNECETSSHGCQGECVNAHGSYWCSEICTGGYNYMMGECKGLENFCPSIVVRNSSGRITSPNWPAFYPPNQSCRWHFSGGLLNKIRLTFLSVHLDGNCDSDNVEILEGQYTLFQKICGDHPVTYRSHHNTLTVIFNSDSQNQGEGFQAIYEWV